MNKNACESAAYSCPLWVQEFMDWLDIEVYTALEAQVRPGVRRELRNCFLGLFHERNGRLSGLIAEKLREKKGQSGMEES